MGKESLFQGSKWNILQAVATGNKSAAGIAKAAKTSLPNVTQQLKLMEAYGFLDTTKEAKETFGKPKRLFTLKRPAVQLSLAKHRFAETQIYHPTDIQSMILSVLFLKNQRDQVALLKYLLTADDIMQHCGVAFLKTGDNEIEILLLTDKIDEIRQKYSSINMYAEGKEVRIVAWTHGVQEIKDGLTRKDHYYEQLIKNPFVLYDPEQKFREII